jgi:uncharacterized protein
MDLTFQQPEDHLYIRELAAEGIRIGEDWYTQPLIVSASQVISDWNVEDAAEISEKSLERIFELSAEIVLLGTGAKQHFLPPKLLMMFHSRNIGIEIMSTDAACRTFNVLVAEERQVVAALLPVEP